MRFYLLKQIILAAAFLAAFLIISPVQAQQDQTSSGQYPSQGGVPQYPPPEYQVPQYPPLPYQQQPQPQYQTPQQGQPQPQYPAQGQPQMQYPGTQGQPTQPYPPSEYQQPVYQPPQYQQPQQQPGQQTPQQLQQPTYQQPQYQQPAVPQQPQIPVPSPGLLFNDPFQRFQMALPQGAEPYSTTYNFGDAQTGIQINIMAAQKDDIYDMAFKSFPSMVQSMGGTIRSNRAASIYGRQGQQIVAMMPDPQTGRQLMTLNVFIPAAKIWIQVISTEAQANYARQLMNMIVQSLQYQ